MKDAMDELRKKLNGMSQQGHYSEVPDSDYLEVLTELYAQLKYAQERIVHLEKGDEPPGDEPRCRRLAVTLHRRAFLTGLATALAAPAVVRAESLMKLWVPPAPKLITSLDDYEEGTWTPLVSYGDGKGLTYMAEPGRYVRVGKLITVSGKLPIPYGPGVTITGLPFVRSARA